MGSQLDLDDVAATSELAMQELQEMRAEIARLRAELEAARVDAGVMNDLVQIVEGIAGAINHGTWRDDNGFRLKDTKEWCNFYVAAKKTDAAIDAARGKDNAN